MGTVTILWSLAAGVSMTLAAACGTVWIISRRNPASLMLCCLGFAAAVAAYLELCLMHASTAAQYGELLRWYHVPIFVTFVSQILFVHYYLGTGRDWLLWAFILARSVILIVNFTVDPNFNFSSITSLQQYSIFGEQITSLGSAVTRVGWQRFALASVFLQIAYFIDAAVRRWRVADSASKRKALMILLVVAVPKSASLVTQAVAFGIIRAPFTNLISFVGTLVLLTIELGRDFVASRRAMDQLAELQSQLARTERVSIAGQLASTLAHELAQPLSANLLNTTTALKYLQLERPDIE
jgi:hypothetical protein